MTHDTQTLSWLYSRWARPGGAIWADITVHGTHGIQARDDFCSPLTWWRMRLHQQRARGRVNSDVKGGENFNILPNFAQNQVQPSALHSRVLTSPWLSSLSGHHSPHSAVDISKSCPVWETYKLKNLHFPKSTGRSSEMNTVEVDCLVVKCQNDN